MNKPVRYYVITENHPNGYKFESGYGQHENIIRRAKSRGDKVKSIHYWSTSTEKQLGSKYY